MDPRFYLKVSLLLLLSSLMSEGRPEESTLCEKDNKDCEKVKKSFYSMEQYVNCIMNNLNRTKYPNVKDSLNKIFKLLDGKRCLARGHMIEIGEANKSASEKMELSKIIQGNGILGNNRLYRDIQELEQELSVLVSDYSFNTCRGYRQNISKENPDLYTLPDPTTPAPPSASEVKNSPSDSSCAVQFSLLLVTILCIFPHLLL